MLIVLGGPADFKLPDAGPGLVAVGLEVLDCGDRALEGCFDKPGAVLVDVDGGDTAVFLAPPPDDLTAFEGAAI